MPYKDPNSQIAKENNRRRSWTWRKRHPEKAKAVKRASYENHRDRIIAKHMVWHWANRENQLIKMRAWRLKRRYGLTVEQYDALGTCCGICGATENQFFTNDRRRKKMLAVDHDKTTNKVRGLLCSNCNIGIALLNHDCNRLQKAMEYLQRAMDLRIAP